MKECAENKYGNCNIDGALCVGLNSPDCPKHRNGCTENYYGNCNITGCGCVAESDNHCPILRKMKD